MTYYFDVLWSHSVFSKTVILILLALSLIIIIYAKIKSFSYRGYDDVIEDICENNRCLVAAMIIEIPFAFVLFFMFGTGDGSSMHSVEMIRYIANVFIFVEGILVLVGVTKIISQSKNEEYVSRSFYILHRLSIIYSFYFLMLLVVGLIVGIIMAIMLILFLIGFFLHGFFSDD